MKAKHRYKPVEGAPPPAKLPRRNARESEPMKTNKPYSSGKKPRG